MSTFTTQIEALTRLANDDLELVIIIESLPEIDGPVMIEKIRRNEARKPTLCHIVVRPSRRAQPR